MDADIFAHWHVDSGDVDPVYPVLDRIIKYLDLNHADRAALILLYVAYYDLGSALTVWLDGWRPGQPLTHDQLRYRTGTERRAHRSVDKFAEHVESLNYWIGYWSGADHLLDPPLTDPIRRWESLQRRLSSIYGNGRWAGYKTGEIADTVLRLNCPPPDAGHAFSSGPRKGLADIFPETTSITGNTPSDVSRLNELTDRLVTRWHLPVAQVETVLCDWHSTIRGHYYIGHDIDLLLDQARRIDRVDARQLVLDARLDAFDHRWLGECNDWTGVRPSLKRLYLDHRRIEWWE